MRFADLDAVTIDAFGTLVDLIDPAPALQTALVERGFDRTADEVGEAVCAVAAGARAHFLPAPLHTAVEQLR
jgi:hypothetical protein